MPELPRTNRPTFREAFRFWLKLGFISFGGPSGQIAIMHDEVVEKRKWIDESHFLHALNYCMLLPGPEAQQLATYIGWLLHGTRGALVAGILFVLPSMFLLWALSWAYVVYGNVPWVAAVFEGVKPVVLAIVVVACIRLSKKALGSPLLWCIAGLAFAAIFFLKAPFPFIIAGAGLVGLLGSVWKPAVFGTKAETFEREEPGNGSPGRAMWIRAIRVCAVCLVLWWAPVLVAGTVLGWQSAVFQQGVFFSKAAMVTFGGAYAVLPYVSQQAVERFGWLTAEQMLDGLGLAETTPGPLIMVLQFVGFVGAWGDHGRLPALLAGTLGALITTWTTFVPCFMWILAGAPYVERLRSNARLAGALSAVTAAVVGVILNLAVWFGWHLIAPRAGYRDWFSLALAIVASTALLRWKPNIVWVVLAGAVAGVLRMAF